MVLARKLLQPRQFRAIARDVPADAFRLREGFREHAQPFPAHEAPGGEHV